MKIHQGVQQFSQQSGRSPNLVLTIGNFDGVHFGHRAIFNKLAEKASVTHGEQVVITFYPHPVQVLFPERQLRRLFSQEDLAQELQKLGIDHLIIEPFSREFSELPPDVFLENWIFGPFNPSSIIVGYDFNFGRSKSGSVELLRETARAKGCDFEIISHVDYAGAPISSSRIRKLLSEGQVQEAAQMLGREFYLEGVVSRGAGRGRTIGVPTANLLTSAETRPAEGVYCGWCWDGRVRYPAVVNIGRAPTFTKGHQVTIEAHLLGEPGDLYGKTLKLEFSQRLRQEMKFASVEALIAQIKMDIAEARARLGVSV